MSVHAYSDVNSIHIEEGIMKSVRLWTLEVGAVQEKELSLCARVGKKVLQGRLWTFQLSHHEMNTHCSLLSDRKECVCEEVVGVMRMGF